MSSKPVSSLKKKKKVGYYEIKDKDWIDVGQMDKYKNFLNKIKSNVDPFMNLARASILSKEPSERSS